MPGSMIDFCEFSVVWSGHVYEKSDREERERMVKEGRIPLPWELLMPVLRILGHCCDNKKSKSSITIYVVGLFVCVKNCGSNCYATGNGWDKVGKLRFLVNILNRSSIFLLVFLQILT